MSEEKKKKRRMRTKKDTILKWFLLPETMFLTNEEFGILVRNAMIEDDKDELRFEDMPKNIKEAYEAKEKEWTDELIKILNNNPIVMSAYTAMIKQTAQSHRAFDQLKQYYANKDNDDDDDDSKENDNQQNETGKGEVIITSAETAKKCKSQKVKVGGQSLMIVYYDEMFAPTQKEIDELRNAYDDESIMKAIREGNKDEWRTDIQSYIDESEDKE